MVGAFPASPLRFLPGRLLLLSLLVSLVVGRGQAAEAVPAPTPPPSKAITVSAPPSVLSKPAPQSVEDLRVIQNHVHKLVETVTPAVVGVRIGPGSGSGVIVSADGYVLTAGHVSGKPGQDAILILPSGKQVKAKSLGSNRNIDSGMLKISEEGPWPFVEMGKSADLKKGQWCITIGHPGGFKPGRTPVVRLGRVLQLAEGHIRTDCTLVGGDSGGPLFDMEGKVIGIHSRIGGTIDTNIHVPVDTYHDTWDRLVKSETWGSVFGDGPSSKTPFLGVEIDREAEGCKIARIVEDSPAEKTGLKADDVLLEFDGVKLKDPDDLSAQLRKKKINDEVTLKVQRGKETLTMKLKLARRPD